MLVMITTVRFVSGDLQPKLKMNDVKVNFGEQLLRNWETPSMSLWIKVWDASVHTDQDGAITTVRRDSWVVKLEHIHAFRTDRLRAYIFSFPFYCVIQKPLHDELQTCAL